VLRTIVVLDILEHGTEIVARMIHTCDAGMTIFNVETDRPAYVAIFIPL